MSARMPATRILPVMMLMIALCACARTAPLPAPAQQARDVTALPAMPVTQSVMLQVVPLALSMANGYLIASYRLIASCVSALESDPAQHDCQVVSRHPDDPLELEAVLPR